MEFDDFDLRAEQTMFPHLDADVPTDTADEEMSEAYYDWLEENDETDTDENRAEWYRLNEDPESRDWANGWGSDGEVDGDALASAGFGTDEDYGYCGGNDDF